MLDFLYVLYCIMKRNSIKPSGCNIPGGFYYARKRGETMPKKPKRPCSHPGCPKLTDGRFCEEHQRQENQRYEKYDRDLAVRRRYGRAWKRIRDRHIAANPLCEECKKHGKLTPAEEVHHILPLSQGGTHEDSNLMSLCKSCHSEITAKEGGRWTSKHRGRGGQNL